jgi:hypothetical protein
MVPFFSGQGKRQITAAGKQFTRKYREPKDDASLAELLWPIPGKEIMATKFCGRSRTHPGLPSSTFSCQERPGRGLAVTALLETVVI